MELWTFVTECNQSHRHDFSGPGLSSELCVGHVNSRYCTIKTIVGVGTHLSMNLPLDTKSILLNEPSVPFDCNLYDIGIGEVRGVVKGHGVPVRLEY